MKMTTAARRSYRTRIIPKGEIKGKGCSSSIPKSQKKIEKSISYMRCQRGISICIRIGRMEMLVSGMTNGKDIC